MNELVPYDGLYYQLNEAKGKFFCVIFAEGEDIAVLKTPTFESAGLAISDAIRIIDEFNDNTRAGNNLDVA
jgi:hypothetical protein